MIPQQQTATTVAVLMTSFNRRETTLRCLSRLYSQENLEGISLEIFLTDDASTDGTSEAVAERFPSVRIQRGSGSLFWVQGMGLADEAAGRSMPDYLLWMNDDVTLENGAIRDLLESAKASDDKAIIVGAVRDPLSGHPTYGGFRTKNRNVLSGMALVPPTGGLAPLDTMNGNVVLVPSRVRKRVGPLDTTFTHNMGDMDYAFRAREAGFKVLLAPRYVGTCETNMTKGQWLNPSVPFHQRMKLVTDVRALPVREWFVFTRRHCGWRWPRYFVGPYLHASLCGLAFRSRRRSPSRD